MNQIETVIAAVRSAERQAIEAARAHWDTAAKPLGSLGLLEEAVIRIAGAAGSHDVDIRKQWSGGIPSI